jgi:transcriptional regulator with XRE-family HTH domain
MISLEKSRKAIAAKVRDLRLSRRWTQAELAGHLELSQSRLSEIENGNGSFTAEQLLLLLRLFNVGVSHFTNEPRNAEAELQNALARLGAEHLQEDRTALPTEGLEERLDVIREAIVGGSSRHLTSLGPVLVSSIDRLDVRRLRADLTLLGFDRRLNWLLENIADALRSELTTSPPPPRAIAQRYRRALTVIDSLLGVAGRGAPAPEPIDFLDPHVRSKQTLDELLQTASPISKRWGVATELKPTDFAQALRAASGR